MSRSGVAAHSVPPGVARGGCRRGGPSTRSAARTRLDRSSHAWNRSAATTSAWMADVEPAPAAHRWGQQHRKRTGEAPMARIDLTAARREATFVALLEGRPVTESTLSATICSTIGRYGTRRCARSEEHTSELQSRPHLVCRLLLEKK